MVGRRSGDLPTPWVDPERGAHARPSSAASGVLTAVGFALMSLLAIGGVVIYVGTLATSTYDQLGGGIGVVFLTLFLGALLIGWLRSLRAMRKRLRRSVGRRSGNAERGRRERGRRGRGRVRTLIGLGVRLSPSGQRRYDRYNATPGPVDKVLPGIGAARTQLSPRDIKAAQRLPSSERPAIAAGGRRAAVKSIQKLSGIERSIGDVLYQLDLARGRHHLTKEQITAVRVAGLRASAWLSGHAQQIDVLGHAAPSDQQIADGIGRYEALARTAEALLGGRGSAAEVLSAKDRLRALVDPAPSS
jgi:hypothetical protein